MPHSSSMTTARISPLPKSVL
ncbi:UNVERIFIED_CONTAM: hypothetical protein GTU68_034360 [Idotea baltica]|nr:hypothetical protein [Idotea baltica]